MTTEQTLSAKLDSETAFRRLHLWFFRDISDEQRKSLFAVCGYPVKEMRTHAIQDLSLRHLVAALASQALRSHGEAVAWQHRGKRRGAKVFAEWRDGRNQSYDTAEGDEFEERRLYTHPAPQEAGEVKVKPLEWVDGKAKTAQVTYAVKKTMFGWSWVAMTGVGAFASKPCAATEDEAKALAQAHHNQAILSSLEPS